MAQPHPKQSFLINVHPQVHSVCWPVNASNISIVWFRYNIFMYMKSFECIYMMYSVRYSSFMQIHAVPHISQNIPPIRDGSQPWDSPATAVPAAAASVFRTFSQLNVLNLVTGGAWWCLVGNSTKSRQFQWLSEKWTVWCGPFRVSTRNVWNKILQHVYMRVSKNDINGAPPNMVFNGIPWAYFCTCVIFKSSCSKRAAKKKEKIFVAMSWDDPNTCCNTRTTPPAVADSPSGEAIGWTGWRLFCTSRRCLGGGFLTCFHMF